MAVVRAATLVFAIPDESTLLLSRITCQCHSGPRCQIRYAKMGSDMVAPVLRREHSLLSATGACSACPVIDRQCRLSDFGSRVHG